MFLIIPFLYSIANSNQLDTLKGKEETKLLPGYNYVKVGEVSDSVYEKAFDEYDLDGDGIKDRCGESLEGLVALWKGVREKDINYLEGIATDFKFEGFIAIIEPRSFDEIKFLENEQGLIDLLAKYENRDAVKVLLYRNKVEDSNK